jgi:integrase
MNKNSKLIEEFLKFKKSRKSNTERTLQIKKDILRRFFEKYNKNIEEIKDKDIELFLDRFNKLSTRNLNIIHLRDFFRWYYKTKELPDCIKDFELANEKAIRRQQKKDRIVTEEEYKKLINGTNDPQYRAILEVLNEFGGRMGEVTSMNSNDIQDTGKLIYATYNESKTVTRTVTTNEDLPYLLRWYNELQPYSNKRDKPLWIGKRTLKRLNPRNFSNSLYDYSYKILGRHITPHDFRHTAITRDRGNGMPDSLIELKYGLVKGSRMMKVYDKNGALQLEKYYLNKLNPEEIREPIEKIKKERDKVKELKKETDGLKEQMKDMEELINSLSTMIKPFYDKKALQDFNKNPDKQTTSFKIDAKD